MAASIGQVQAVAHALSVLEALAHHGPGLGVAEVSRAVGLPRSTACRLLSTLDRRGYVERGPVTREYRLGLKLFELAGIVSRNQGLRAVALPLLERLARGRSRRRCI